MFKGRKKAKAEKALHEQRAREHSQRVQADQQSLFIGMMLNPGDKWELHPVSSMEDAQGVLQIYAERGIFMTNDNTGRVTTTYRPAALAVMDALTFHQYTPQQNVPAVANAVPSASEVEAESEPSEGDEPIADEQEEAIDGAKG